MFVRFSIFLLFLFGLSFLYAEEEPVFPESVLIPLVHADSLPVLRDTAWCAVTAVLSADSERVFYAGAMISDTDIALLISFPAELRYDSPAEWIWSDTRRCYLPGIEKELCFTLLITEDPLVDLSSGDVWRWRSGRNFESGMADDCYYRRPSGEIKNSALFVDSGIHPDQGNPAWRSRFYGSKIAERVKRFYRVQGEGSAADVRVEAMWEGGYWTLLFKRHRGTGNRDDVVFALERPLLMQFSVEIPAETAWFSPPLVLPESDDAESRVPLLPDETDSEWVSGSESES